MIIEILKASRPKTLIAAACPVLLGSSWAFHRLGHLEWSYFWLILTISFSIQIATNFYNDALDGEKGRDTEKRLGPKRFSGQDVKIRGVLKKAALTLLILSFLIGVFLAYKTTPLILFAGLPALFLAYLYTGTSYSLSANGWADAFVVLYFGVLPVWVTELVLTGEGSFEAVWSGLQCGLLCNVLLVINNLRDFEEDKETGKRTLIVKKGRAFGLGFLAFCMFVPFVLNFISFEALFFRACWWTTLLFIPYLILFVKIKKNKPSEKYNKYLAFSSVLLLTFTILFSAGVLSS